MSYLVLVVLSALWLGVFLPSLLQARRSSPLASASSFQESLTRISLGQAVDAADPRTRPPRTAASRRDLERRRDTLLALVAAVVGAAALGLSFGGVMRWLVIPPAAALAGYVVLLRAWAVRSRPAARHGVPARRAAPSPAAGGVQRRSAAAETDLQRLAG